MSFSIVPGESVVVVTGATGGIGRAFCKKFAEQGANLIIIARTAAALDTLAADLRSTHGVEVTPVACDLADREHRSSLIEQLQKTRVDVLCNVAGIATFGELVALDPQGEKTVVDLNAVALHEVTMSLIPRMVERGSGGIINVGSSAGELPIPGNATYAATKSFVNSFSQSLSYELRKTGVHVTLLSPGPVRPVDRTDNSIIDKVIPNFLWITPESAVEKTLHALEKNKRMIIPGLLSKLLALAGRYVPSFIVLPIISFVYSFLAHSLGED